MSSSGGAATRITFSGNYNVSPAISPDGRWLAYISRSGGALRLQVMELASGNVASITDTSNDEHPSFAPNSRLILYASNERSLVTTTLDGKIKARLAVQGGSVHQPVWGPYQK
jgi:TolB protein